MLWSKYLLSKLDSFGVIRSIVYERIFQVQLHQFLSRSFLVSNGTPQGSVNNPMLVNDVANDWDSVRTRSDHAQFVVTPLFCVVCRA